MKLELGGGCRSRGDGWVNVDMTPNADIHHNLNVRPWPFDDDSVDEIYSSHCIEHLGDPLTTLHECARVGKVGCPVEIRVPHPRSDLALVVTHRHVFSPVQAINMDVHFPADFWPHRKRLKLLRFEFAPTFMLHQARMELPFLVGLDDQTIMKWIPGTAHETRFYYVVQLNEFQKP
jgi:hypothetical protein